MLISGTTQGDLFGAFKAHPRGFVKPLREYNKTVARGTQALPSGRMYFEGTTMGELGNMYRLREPTFVSSDLSTWRSNPCCCRGFVKAPLRGIAVVQGPECGGCIPHGASRAFFRSPSSALRK